MAARLLEEIVVLLALGSGLGKRPVDKVGMDDASCAGRGGCKRAVLYERVSFTVSCSYCPLSRSEVEEEEEKEREILDREV